MINIVYAGRFGDSAKLAGVGLGTTFLNIICLIPLKGINSAQDVFTTKAYGEGNLKMCGHYLNRGRIITTLLFTVMVIILYFSKGILLHIG